jgi:hypothetical protein
MAGFFTTSGFVLRRHWQEGSELRKLVKKGEDGSMETITGVCAKKTIV